MAAHVLTAMKEIYKQCEDGTVNFNHLEAALNLSCWTEDLDLPDYQVLSHAVRGRSVNDLEAFLELAYPFYKKQWKDLGHPKTREDWRAALFGDKND